jgi:hypothetical protein
MVASGSRRIESISQRRFEVSRTVDVITAVSARTITRPAVPARRRSAPASARATLNVAVLFSSQDGVTLLDSEGSELPDLAAVRHAPSCVAGRPRGLEARPQTNDQAGALTMRQPAARFYTASPHMRTGRIGIRNKTERRDYALPARGVLIL